MKDAQLIMEETSWLLPDDQEEQVHLRPLLQDHWQLKPALEEAWYMPEHVEMVQEVPRNWLHMRPEQLRITEIEEHINVHSHITPVPEDRPNIRVQVEVQFGDRLRPPDEAPVFDLWYIIQSEEITTR